ncbi:hypothetical protein LTR94_037293, partial [Friedmanniomyces endolithicus]
MRETGRWRNEGKVGQPDRLLRSAIAVMKFVIVHYEIADRVDQRPDARDQQADDRTGQQQHDDARSGLAEIETVDAKRAEEEGEQHGGDL